MQCPARGKQCCVELVVGQNHTERKTETNNAPSIAPGVASYNCGVEIASGFLRRPLPIISIDYRQLANFGTLHTIQHLAEYSTYWAIRL